MSTSHRSETTTLGDFADFFAQAEPQEKEPEPPPPTARKAQTTKAKQQIQEPIAPPVALPEPQVTRREDGRNVTLDDNRDFLNVATALANLKAELMQAGLLQKTNVKSSFLQVTEFVATRPKVAEQERSPLVAQKFRYQRQQVLSIAAQMQQAKNSEDLLNITLENIQDTLEADRLMVYRFDSDKSGQVVAEILQRGFTPTIGSVMAAATFGEDQASGYLTHQVVTIDDTYKAGLSPYQQQLMDQLQVKSSLCIPIAPAGQAWGLLVAHQCSKPRSWQEVEINLLYQLTLKLAMNLERFEFSAKLKQQGELEKAVVKVIDKVRRTTDIDTIFKTTTQEVRQLLKVDRVAVYRFSPDWSGEFIAESVATGWTKLVGPDIKTVWEDTHLQETQGGRYRRNESFAIDDIYKTDHHQCHIEVLEQFEAKAYVIVPVFLGATLWGLLGAYQNSGTRHWEESEINFLAQIGSQFGSALQVAEYVQEAQLQSERKRVIANTFDRIRQAQDVTSILRSTTQEVRQLLRVDRVAVYRFNSDWSGEFISESVATGWIPLVGAGIKTVWEDTHLQETEGGRYRNNESFKVDDIYKAGHFQCHVEMLEQFQVRAYMISPVFIGEKLWGLIGAYQNSDQRRWQQSEVDLLAEVGIQLGLTVRQAELLREAQERAERIKVLSKIVESVRKSLDVKSIFRTATQELRQQLRADRVAIYRFNPDWSGDFIAESVATGWEPLVGPDVKTVWADSHLQDTQGGRYRDGETFTVDDIYKAGHFQCHLEILEQFQVQAYVIAPIFAGDKLWGLLAAYQNSGPRRWQESEVSLLAEIGPQLGLSIQQAEVLNKAQVQAEREKTVARIIENVRKSLEVRNIFRVATQEVRQLFKADRVAVYRFNPDWSGEFVAESVTTGWTPLVGPDIKTVWADTHLQDTQGGRYRNNETFGVDDIYSTGDIYNAGLSTCHIELLEQFQARSYAIVPVFSGQKLWGLLAAYQNTGPRTWEDAEISLLMQIGIQLGVTLQQAELINESQKQAEREKTLAKVVDRIRKSLDIARQLLDINTIFNATTQEVRAMLKTDRVALYKFEEDWSGSFIAESFSPGWSPLVGTEVGTNVQDTYLKENKGGRYSRQESLAIDDIYEAGHDPCHVKLLEKFQCRAYVLVPVFVSNKLWGILGTYENAQPRKWETEEINLLNQIALQMGVALEQYDSLEQVRVQSAQLAAASAKDKAANEQLQQQVMQMLMAVRPVLNGDLTVRVPVSEDAIGTIADAYNNTIQSLRKIVTQVQSAAVKMSETSGTSETAIAMLSHEAQQQFQQVNQAIDRIQSMVNSTQAVTENAKQVQTAVQQANQTVKAGDTAMNKTVDGIMAIRETVAETSKKIKRLSESSQKISKVVSLISNFTTQTQLLALNASIEATRAGEYGRGFSVVADEVRSLSRQSAEATREIEKLVQEIQAETVEVTTAMDVGIQQVVGGTNLVNETRQQLNEIVIATAQISQLVQGITQATQVQTQQSQLVTQAMSDVAAIANKTSTDSTQISASFQELLATAQQLQASVGQFKVK
jgi:methyl-accepting chemotaxis protein PixJ